MDYAPDGRGQGFTLSAATVKQNTETLFNQLLKAGIEIRLLGILNELFAEKTRTTKPDDLQYIVELTSEIQSVLNMYIGLDLKIILMQRLVMYGVNSPKLVSYYYDAFMRLDQMVNQEERRKTIGRLIKKTEVTEFYRFYEQYPTLKESLQEQLYAQIKYIEKEEYGFFTMPGNAVGPLYKLGVKPAVFMYVNRTLEETGILERLTKRQPLYNFMSQVIISDEGKKLQPKTFKNRFVYDNIQYLDTAIEYVQKMKERLKFAKAIEMRK